MEKDVKKYRLEGLSCASCAIKIEEELKKEGFEYALVNFATKEALIKGDPEKAKEVIRKVEPMLRLSKRGMEMTEVIAVKVMKTRKWTSKGLCTS